MLDLNYVRENPDQVYAALAARHASEETFALLRSFVDADKERRSAIAESDRLNSERNKLSQQVGMLMKQGKADEALSVRTQVGDLKERAARAEAVRAESEDRMRDILISLPNIPHESVPHG